MALAFLFEDDTVMFVDAVTSYNKSRNSSISTHPIDNSSVISDHVAKENPVFSIRGIISSADFHTDRPFDLLADYTLEDVYNTPVEDAVIPDDSSLLDFLPGTVQQFLSQPESNIEIDPFRGYSHQIARDRLNDAWDSDELITLLDYDYDAATGTSIAVRQVANCLIRSFEDTEDVDTGDALSFQMTLESIRFAYIKETDVEVIPVESQISDAAANETNKGDADGDSDLDVEGGSSVFESIEEGASNIVNEITSGFGG